MYFIINKNKKLMQNYSDTQTCAVSEEYLRKDEQKTQKKKNKKRKVSQAEETPKKKQKKSLKQSAKVTQPKKGVRSEKIQVVKSSRVKLKQNIKLTNCISHSSVCQKFTISLLLSFFSILLFAESPPIDYPLAHFQEGTHEPVFEIVTDRKTKFLTFHIQKQQKIIWGLSSTKTANVKVEVKYNLGYKFKNKYFESNSLTPAKHSQIEMSDLIILQYSIVNISLINQQDGYLNSWDFNDHQGLVNFVEQKYLKQMQQEALASITDERKKKYENKAKFMLTEMIDRSESWFDWLIKRVDTYLEGGLKPFVKNIEISYQNNQEQKQQ